MATETFEIDWSISLFDKCPSYFDLYDKHGRIALKLAPKPVPTIAPKPVPTIAPTLQVNPIEIICKTLTGARIIIHIDEFKLVFNLKQDIYKKTDIMIDDQRLVYNGKILDDMKTIESYNIMNGTTINMVCRLRGGMFHSTSSRADFVSLNFTSKFQSGSKMIVCLRTFNICLDTLNELEHRLHTCKTDEQIDKIYELIKSVYLS